MFNCALGNDFTITISANRTLSFVNVPVGAFACTVRATWTGGVITLPPNTILLNGKAITFKSGVWRFEFATNNSGANWDLVAGAFS